MNELQRMQYLEAMGIEMFAPRWILPGAPRSRQCPLPPPSEVGARGRVEGRVAGSPVDRVRSDEKEHTPPVGALVDQLLKKTPPDPAPTKPSKTPVSPQPATAPAPVEKAAFTLGFWRVHPDVMVVDSRQPKLLPTEALLQSVLTAINVTQKLPALESQKWPVSEVGDQSWPAAREMIHAFLEGRLLSHPVRYLVLMGRDAARAVLEPGTSPDAGDGVPGRVTLDNFACDALLTPSLADLLLQPELKASLWRLLAPLRELNAKVE